MVRNLTTPFFQENPLCHDLKAADLCSKLCWHNILKPIAQAGWETVLSLCRAPISGSEAFFPSLDKRLRAEINRKLINGLDVVES